jgi:hypothetical protein
LTSFEKHMTQVAVVRLVVDLAKDPKVIAS